jgi:hypothetical protein
MTNVDANTIRPVVCNDPAGCVSGGVLAAAQRGRVPQGTTYIPVGTRPSPFISNSFMFFFGGTNSYNGLDLSLTKRFSDGLSFRANYTFSKALDLNSSQSAQSPTGASGANSPLMVFTRYNLGLSRGPAAFNLKNKFNANFSYELPFGSGKAFGSSASGLLDKMISGWQWNGILSVRDGIPFTPQVGRNISGNGDSRTPDLPDRNPNFSGPFILGEVERWYDPNAFQLPIPGTFGNNGRGHHVGPGLFTVDTSLFKGIALSESWDMQFRFEVFNAFNHVNFAVPNLVVFSGNAISSTAGRITNTATNSRELQFALRLTF